MKIYNDKNIGIIISTPGKRLSDSGHANTLMLISILKNFHNKIYLFTEEDFCAELNGNIQVFKIKKPYKNSYFPRRIMGYIYYELKMAILVKKFSKEIDIFYFTELLFPIFVAWLFRKKGIFILGSSGFKEYLVNNTSFHGKIIAWFMRARRCVMYLLVNNIIVYSKKQLKFDNIEQFENKTIIWHYVYVDLKVFCKSKDLGKREEIIGYVGTISKIKGIEKFIKAIPMVLSLKNNVSFLFIGDGPDLDLIKSYVEELGCSKNAEFTGWIPNKDLPRQLNKMKLFINPSETEGIPKTILEAMACGTPVLATSVGGITDVIKDGKTGYILNDNSSDGITKSVIQILESDNLEKVAENARELIENRYTYEDRIIKYQYLLNKL